jgi:hypothetical protein
MNNILIKSPRKLNILEVEKRLLKSIKKIIRKTNGKIAKSNLFDGIDTNDILCKIITQYEVSDDFGYGHCISCYTWNLEMNYCGEIYDGTIYYSYFGGSCYYCDDIQNAEGNNTEEEYMTKIIASLKFKYFNKSLKVNSLTEFPLL